MIRAVDHVAILCRDLEKSVEYYTKKLGFSVMLRTETPTLNVVFVEANQAKLELFGAREGVPTTPSLKETDIGLKHIAFLVDDVDKAYKELSRKGVKFTSEPRATARGGHKIAFFNDPDGNVLQITQW